MIITPMPQMNSRPTSNKEVIASIVGK